MNPGVFVCFPACLVVRTALNLLVQGLCCCHSMVDYLTVHTVQVLPCASFKTTSCCGRNINMPMPCPCLPNLLQWQASSPGEALLPRSNPSSSSSRKKYSRLQTHHRDHSHSEMMNGQSFHNRCHSMRR